MSANIHEKLFLEAIKSIDNSFFESGIWKNEYNCNGFVSRTIITPFCEITFRRRYYMNKNRSLHDNFYFVDRQLGIPSYKHLTNEALAVIFNVAVEVNSSYASKHAIPNVVISKQTVSNYQKNMNTISDSIPTIPDDIYHVDENIDIIYVEADEAHCNLQQFVSVNDSSDEIKFHHRSTIKVHSKNVINKLVLTHSGHKYPDLHLKRKELNNKRYFGGIHIDTSVLADNVFDSIHSQYDLNKVKYVFVSGDGAFWIKSLAKNLSTTLRSYNLQVISVLDKFHTNKYLRTIFSSDNDVINYVKNNFSSMTTDRFKNISNAYFAFKNNNTSSEKYFLNCVNYICNNLKEINNQKHPFYKFHCAMEGQISHILAKRLTSRPGGFSEKVLQNLTQMIIRKSNGLEITPDVVKCWSKEYLTYQNHKYIHPSKNWKPIYNSDVDMPILNSTNTNLKRAFYEICHPKFN